MISYLPCPSEISFVLMLHRMLHSAVKFLSSEMREPGAEPLS